MVELGLSDGQTLTNLPSQYQIRRQSAWGVEGCVFEAFDRNRGQSVSIALFRDYGPADNAEELLERLQLHMGLSHPSLALPLDSGRSGGSIFIVTPLEGQGIRLSQVLKDRRPELIESARWIAEIAEAIQYLDEHDVLCWDVKPGTIIVDPEGRAMLTDLWEHTVIAEKALPGEVCGTLAYMPPERVSGMGGPLDCCCATYSLGIVLYELLTGICPFAGSGRQETLQKMQTATPRSPRAVRRSIPKVLEVICLKAMARKPEDRYATPGDLAQALRQFLSGQTDRKKSFWKRR
jgi:serine/threonine protein kinase